MKRFCLSLWAALLCVWASAQSVSEIRSVDIRVELQQDGSAWVTQVWDVEVNTSGTEWYMPVGNLGPMTVSNLSVHEGGVKYESLGTAWDVNRSRSYKSGKCGIVPAGDGVELCWGLGEPGSHIWTARFLLTGLVQAYDDADAFNFQFVNRGMSPAPADVRLTIIPAFDCPAWTYDNTRVWGFGFYGDIQVENGAVVARSTESLTPSSAVIALVKFEKGIFHPTVTVGGPFQNLLDRALEGSSYGEDEGPGWAFIALVLFLMLFGLGVVAWMVIASALGYKWNKKLLGSTKIDTWWRDIPLEGNLMAAQFVMEKGRRFPINIPTCNLIGALFLRWIMDGKIHVQPDPASSKRVNLLFEAETVSADDIEEDLYQMALSAAGGNRLLEKNEFEKWSTRNAKKMAAWPDRALARGRSWFHGKGYFVRDGVCSEQGALEARHVVEFKNFLKEFTLSDQRGASEVKLWKEYLVYAQLFGIADKVASQFKKLYPAEFSQLAESTGLDASTLVYTVNWTGSMSAKAFAGAVAKTTGSASGTGGFTSFGGGGGFSGGGFGGGAR